MVFPVAGMLVREGEKPYPGIMGIRNKNSRHACFFSGDYQKSAPDTMITLFF